MPERFPQQDAILASTKVFEASENAENFTKTLIFLAFSVIVLSAFVSGSFERAHYWYNLSFVTRFLSDGAPSLPGNPLLSL